MEALIGRARAAVVPALALVAFLAVAGVEIYPPMLHVAPGAGGPRPPEVVVRPPSTRRLVIVILDAWRRRDAFDDAKMPFVAALARRGARGSVETGYRTFTRPGLRRMFTGRRPTLRDSALNLSDESSLDDSLFSRARASGLSCVAVDASSAFSSSFGWQLPPGSVIQISPGEPSSDPDDIFNDEGVERAAGEAIERGSAAIIVIHIDDVDHAGHLFTTVSERFDRILRAADRRVGRIAGRLDLRRDTIFIVGDHGADDLGHHGGAEVIARQTAFVAAGAGIRPSGLPLAQEDVGDTLAILLGICPPVSSEGTPSANLLDIDPKRFKRLCDACLVARVRSTSSAADAWLASSEAKTYFAAAAFGPREAELYRSLANPKDDTPPTLAEGLVGALLLGMGALYSREARG